MVIVDTRSTGGRGETGIPTDAYFEVEEIRDVGHDAILFAVCAIQT
jgi:26S proteasome regulatory subunit N8